MTDSLQQLSDWLDSPEQSVLGPKVVLEALQTAEAAERSDMLDGLWSRLQGTGLALELANQLDEWAQESPEARVDALAARVLARAHAPSALIESAWLRELKRQGPEAVDWQWFSDRASTVSLVVASSMGERLDQVGKRVLAKALLARQRYELFDLLKAVGVDACGLDYATLAHVFGGDQLAQLPLPEEDSEALEVLRLRYEGGDRSACVEALQRVQGVEGPSDAHERVAGWLVHEGERQQAMDLLKTSSSDQSLRLLWESEAWAEMVERLESIPRRSESQTVFLARALSQLGKSGATALLDDAPGPEAYRLKVGLALEEGRVESLVSLLKEGRQHGLDGERAWMAFDLLHKHHPKIASDLVLDQLEESPSSEALDRLVSACERREDEVLVLDYLVDKDPNAERWNRRLEVEPSDRRGALLARRALWWPDASEAIEDLRTSGTSGLTPTDQVEVAGRLLIKHPQALTVADELVHLGLRTQDLGAVVHPCLEAARRQAAVGGARLIARVGAKLVGCGATQQLGVLLLEAQGLAPDLPEVIAFWAAVEAEEGDLKAARTRLVAAALERPGTKAGEGLALLALDYMDPSDPGTISLARLWPQQARLVEAYCEARLANGERLEMGLLAQARGMSPRVLRSIWLRGLESDPSDLAAIVQLDDREALNELVRHGVDQSSLGFLRRLASRLPDSESVMLDWAQEALQSGRPQLAYDLIVGDPETRSKEETALALRALSQGAKADEDRLYREGLRALELDLSDEDLIQLVLRTGGRRELLQPLLERNPDHIELISVCRDHAPELLKGSTSPVVTAALCRSGEPVATVDSLFGAAADAIGRHPVLLVWWAECVPDREMKLLVEAAEANPGPWGAQQLLRAARSQVADERGDALVTLRQALKMDPDSVAIRRALSDLLREDQPEAALELLEPVLTGPDRDQTDIYRYARLSQRLGHLEAAAAAFEQAGIPQRLDVLQEGIPVFTKLGRDTLARDWIRELIRFWGEGLSRTELSLEYTRLAQVELNLHALDVAQACARRAMELDETSPEAMELLGRTLLESDEHFDEGLQLLEEAARRCPRTRRAALLAEIGMLSQDPWHRADLLEEARRLGGQLASSQLYCLAEALKGTARSNEAILIIEAAVDHCEELSTQRQYLVWMGDLAFRQLGRLDSALKAWQRALQADPRDEEVLHRVTAACEESGRYEELVDTLVRVIENESDEERRHRLWQRVAETADVHLSRPDLAARAYGEMLQIHDSIPLREQLAARLVDEGKGDEAQQVLLEAWTRQRLSEAGATLLCKSLELAGRVRQALAVDDVECLRGRNGQTPDQRQLWSGALDVPEPLSVTELRSLMPQILREDAGQYLAEAWSVVHPLVKQDPRRNSGWLKRRRQLMDEGDERLFTRCFYRVGRMFRQPDISLYLEPGSSEALAVLPSQPLCLVVGAQSPLLRADDPRVVRFHVARMMMMTRPEVALLGLLGLERTQDLCAAVGLRANVVSQRRVAQWRSLLSGGLEFRLRRSLDPLPMQQMVRLAAAAEMMALRAGLIAAGDLNLSLDLALQCEPILARLDQDELVQSLGRFWARSGLAYRVEEPIHG